MDYKKNRIMKLYKFYAVSDENWEDCIYTVYAKTEFEAWDYFKETKGLPMEDMSRLWKIREF